MKFTRIDVATAVTAIVLTACVYPVYNDIVRHQIEATSGVTRVARWIIVALLYAIEGASVLYCARRVATWIFSGDAKNTAHL
jgi:hypothetical protein